MSKWEDIIKRFASAKVAVLGDLMIDAYVWGNTNRISPEAPVPVVQISEKDRRLGGAANVAKNTTALGAKTLLLGVTGKDRGALDIERLCQEQGIQAALFKSELKETTVKTRVIAQDQHLLRIDEECELELPQEASTEYGSFIIEHLGTFQPDVLILEDYDKGALNPYIIQTVVEYCQKQDIPVCVDPKKKHFLDFKGVDLFKPNLKECKEGLNISIDPTQTESIHQAHLQLKDKLHHKNTLITLSEHGVFFAGDGPSAIFPAFKRKIIDVSGAGDTVISVAALALSQNCTLREIALLSNCAGGLVCEHIGVVSIQPEWLINEKHELDRLDQ